MKIKEYEYAEDIVNMVIDRIAPACILVSEGGLGKSYLVKTQCEERCPKNYKYFSGHITPKQLFVYLYTNKDKIIILDDVEELLKNDKAVGILKSALWSVKGKRIVSYATTNKDGSSVHVDFEFSGGVIILTNRIPRTLHPTVQALKTRGLVLELKLTYKQKIYIMEQILQQDSFYHLINQELSFEDRKKLIKDLKENTSIAFENFNFRTMEKLVMFYAYNKIVHPDKPNRHIELHRITNKIDEDKELVYTLIQKKLPVNSMVAEFSEKTGKSRATFYRIKKAIEEEIKADNKQENESNIILLEQPKIQQLSGVDRDEK